MFLELIKMTLSSSTDSAGMYNAIVKTPTCSDGRAKFL